MEERSTLTNQELYDKIYEGVTSNKENILILVCAIVIASIGLNMNSQPVVIGAMLISPIMAPVQGIGMGLATFDSRLTSKAFKILLLEALFAISAAAIYFFVSPITYPSAEILSRTQPTIWDAIIAIFGGVAGIVGARKKEANNIVPGVAIATTLMPPLCVMGYGLYERNLSFFLGAGYLFLVNVFCIILTAFVVLQVLRISTRKLVKHEEAKKRNYLMIALAIVMIIPGIVSAGSLVKKQVDEQQVKNYVSNEFSDYYVLSQTIDSTNHTLTIDTIGSELSQEQLKQLENKLQDYQLDGYKLTVTQVANSESLSLKDLDRYLQERGQEERNTERQPVEAISNDASLKRKMEGIKQDLFREYPNRIRTITLKENETNEGDYSGTIELTLGDDVSEEEQQTIQETAESYVKKQDKTISLEISK